MDEVSKPSVSEEKPKNKLGLSLRMHQCRLLLHSWPWLPENVNGSCLSKAISRKNVKRSEKFRVSIHQIQQMLLPQFPPTRIGWRCHWRKIKREPNIRIPTQLGRAIPKCKVAAVHSLTLRTFCRCTSTDHNLPSNGLPIKTFLSCWNVKPINPSLAGMKYPFVTKRL